MADSIFSRIFNRLAEFFTGSTPWHELGPTLGIARLFRIRDRLREHNLHDTSKVMNSYPEDRYVGAALELFAGVALLFWYVLRLLSRRS